MPIKDKFKVKKDILTHQGTLHKDDIVTLEEDYSPDKHTTKSGTYEYKVTDSVGKIWYVHKNDVKPL
tara:strand:+ start:220 stop:420 length:201 start_codon:yes stop_codon:yes gene_type:complete